MALGASNTVMMVEKSIPKTTSSLGERHSTASTQRIRHFAVAVDTNWILFSRRMGKESLKQRIATNKTIQVVGMVNAPQGQRAFSRIRAVYWLLAAVAENVVVVSFLKIIVFLL